MAKVLKLRVFSDEAGHMNHALHDMDGKGHSGGLMIVSQFTLAADVCSGNRPSFGNAAPPEDGKRLYDHAVATARRLHPEVATGVFGAHMQIHLINDGPVTIPIRMSSTTGR